MLLSGGVKRQTELCSGVEYVCLSSSLMIGCNSCSSCCCGVDSCVFGDGRVAALRMVGGRLCALFPVVIRLCVLAPVCLFVYICILQLVGVPNLGAFSRSACFIRRCDRSVSIRLYEAGQYGQTDRCGVCEWKWCHRLVTSLPQERHRQAVPGSRDGVNMLWYDIWWCNG